MAGAGSTGEVASAMAISTVGAVTSDNRKARTGKVPVSLPRRQAPWSQSNNQGLFVPHGTLRNFPLSPRAENKESSPGCLRQCGDMLVWNGQGKRLSKCPFSANAKEALKIPHDTRGTVLVCFLLLSQNT